VIDDSLVTEENPRYRFPSKREREGKAIEFRKTHFLYNGFRVWSPVDRLVVVEGFCSVWWLHQHAVTDVVALMGNDCAERQADLIVSLVNPSGEVWIMPDGNEAGERCAESSLMQISPHRLVRWLKPAQDQQPTDLSPEQIKALFTR
jgi:DNA primase